MILTDEEIYELHARHYGKMYDEYTRAIEAAIMAKFEITAWFAVDQGGAHLKFEPNKYHNWTPLYALKEK